MRIWQLGWNCPSKVVVRNSRKKSTYCYSKAKDVTVVKKELYAPRCRNLASLRHQVIRHLGANFMTRVLWLRKSAHPYQEVTILLACLQIQKNCDNLLSRQDIPIRLLKLAWEGKGRLDAVCHDLTLCIAKCKGINKLFMQSPLWDTKEKELPSRKSC